MNNIISTAKMKQLAKAHNIPLTREGAKVLIEWLESRALKILKTAEPFRKYVGKQYVTGKEITFLVNKENRIMERLKEAEAKLKAIKTQQESSKPINTDGI